MFPTQEKPRTLEREAKQQCVIPWLQPQRITFKVSQSRDIRDSNKKKTREYQATKPRIKTKCMIWLKSLGPEVSSKGLPALRWFKISLGRPQTNLKRSLSLSFGDHEVYIIKQKLIYVSFFCLPQNNGQGHLEDRLLDHIKSPGFWYIPGTPKIEYMLVEVTLKIVLCSKKCCILKEWIVYT